MTFDELVTEVMARTRQTTDEAKTRIGREVNDRYRRLTSSIGLVTSRRANEAVVTTPGSPELTFDGEKILAVYLVGENRRVLGEITFDEWRNAQTWAPATGTPTRYAIASQTSQSVTIYLDPVPQSAMSIEADVLKEAGVLIGASLPDFAPSFHDVLMHGALSDEWMQLKQDDLSKRAEAMWEVRTADLRLFLAKSAYLNIMQGGRGPTTGGAYWPAYALPRWWR